MQLTLNPNRLEDYNLFLQIKQLPRSRFVGRMAEFPDEYASRLGLSIPLQNKTAAYHPSDFCFDYQGALSGLSIRKKKFALFMACGRGKTIVYLEYIKHVRKLLAKDRRILMISPLMVIRQTLEEAERWYGSKLPMEQIHARDLKGWLRGAGKSTIGITNYEAITPDLEQGCLGCLVPDESSYLKSAYGKWGTKIVDLGRGLEWKLAGTGTPAPNDRIEYANHAVLLDAFPTINSFLGKFFINRGQTDSRWELKPHAIDSFYRALSHWCIFMDNPATYGFKNNVANLPPIETHIHDVDMTDEQKELVQKQTGTLFAHQLGGIKSRSVLSQIGKGNYRGQDVATRKPEYIRKLVDSWPDESTIIWCLYNREQELLEKTFPDAASIDGQTPYEDRERMIADFKAKRNRVLISKAKCLGFGLNLQACTRMVFSGINDSWESYHQCVKRANRVGSTLPLNVHIPVVDVEVPMVDNVLRKAKRVQEDTEMQERIFMEAGYEF